MSEFWEGIRPLLDALGVEAWAYPLLVGFGIAHQFACGYVVWWGRGASFVSALVFASLFGALSAAEHGLSPLMAASRGLTLLAAALLAEGAANLVAKKFGLIPKFNEKVQ